MLNKIDNWLINSTQWLVRRTELSTHVTRKDIVTFFLLVLKWLIVAYFLLTIMEFTIGHYLSGTIGLINSSIYSMIQISMKENLQKEQKIALPSEIITRSGVRKFFLLFVIVSLPLIAHIAYIDHKEIHYICAIILFCIMFTLTILEYLLCTTSLPPGEKRRCEQEKEIVNMQGSLT